MDPETSQRYSTLLEAAEGGSAAAMDSISLMYANGEVDGQKNYSEALKWMKKASDLGHVDSTLSIGYFYLNGWGVNKDFTTAVKWYEKGANELNSPKAMASLGELFHNWDSEHRDLDKAMYWYKKGATAGDSNCMMGIGFILDAAGKFSEAFQWYERSAKAGNPYAMNLVAHMYEDGEGCKKDRQLAIFWYKQAVAKGEENAKLALKRLGVH